MKTDHPSPNPPAWVALLIIVFLVCMVSLSVSYFGSDSLEGANQMSLLLTTALCALVGMTFYRARWEDIEECAAHNVGGVAMPLVILLVIGALSGTWMLSGIVPTLIYYGLQMLSPTFFLASCCVICSVVSVMTGSSWTTVATIGMAMMGIGRAMGFDDGWIAGAIISGAYFGDKISPLSDTTVLVSSTCRVPIFTHIRYMLITTVPSITVALVVFVVAGLMHDAASVEHVDDFSAALTSRFNLTLWVLLVPVATGLLIARRVPSVITLFLSALLAMVVAAIAQPEALCEVGGDDGLLRGLMISFYGSTSLATSNALLSDLVSTHGMAGMMPTVWLIICAIIFGAVMQATGMLDAITRVVVRVTRGMVSLVAGTVLTGFFLNATTSDQYLSAILSSRMFLDVYHRRGYEARLLSRAVEDGTTVTSVLVPWNTCGMTQATVLGVATLTYLPYAVFCYVSPLMSIAVAALRIRIRQTFDDGQK